MDRPSQEILKIRDGIPLEGEGILTYRKKILKIRDGTPLEAEGILTYKKSPRNGSVLHFSSKLDVPSNVVQKKRVAQILVFKMRPSQEILKIRDGTPLEAEGILTYRKKALEIDRPSQEILKIRDGIPLEGEGILTYRKSPQNGSVCPRNGSVLHFFSKLDVPSNVVQNKRVAQILVFKIRPSQEILKIRDGIPLEGEGIFTYRKSPQNGSVWHFSSKPSQEILKIRDVFKMRPSQEILKIRDGTPLEAEGILTYRKKPSKWIGEKNFDIQKKSPRNGSVLHFSSKLDVPSNVVQKKRVARILVFKMRPSQEILKIRDGTPLEAEGILTYKKSPRNGSVLHFSSKLDVPSNVVQKKRVAQILVFKMRPSQEILKIRDGTPLEAEGILTYKKSPRNGSVLHFSSKLDVPSNVVQKKRVAQILVFKMRPSQEILKIRDGTPLEAEGILTFRKKALEIDRFGTFLAKILKIRDGIPLEGEGILTYRKKPSQEILKIRDEILKIRDGTPLEAEGILTYKKSPRNGSVLHFSSKLDVPSNVVQKKRVAQILVFKMRPSQEILKIRDGTPLEKF
ncbi:hypothetical protein OROHE_020071 [Orobanche hederae]